jgi:hypothetical protein
MTIPYQFSVSDGGSSGPKEKRENPARQSQITWNMCCEDCEEEEEVEEGGVTS